MSIVARFADWAGVNPVATGGITAALALAAACIVLARRRTRSEGTRRKFSAGTVAAAAAFVICTSVSLNTSYRFTGATDGLDMTDTMERLLSCAGLEALIAMSVLGAREHMDGETKSPGWYGSAVWIFAALSSVPAWHEGGGFTPGTAVRIIVGSFGSALAAHSALGLELRHRTGDDSQSPLAQIARDLRERAMALLGLAHRNRTAQQIERDRALSKAVDLADRYHRFDEKKKTAHKGAKTAKKLARALDRAGCADDEAQREAFRSRVALRRFGTEMEITPAESPWHKAEEPAETERAIDVLAERIRHMEHMAEEAEDAVAAQIGTASRAENLPASAQETKTPAAAETRQHGVSTRLPRQHRGQDQEDRAAQLPKPPRDLSSYSTKRAALEALYAVRIDKDDNRTTNAIAEDLLGELAEAGVTLDRGAANRYVGELRTQINAVTQAEQLVTT
jgi:hypothetical protein